uniref:Uncharacterized protein n=1 Tax=Clytia hemisphaerica TaxID=252671 RepID=A0A7M5UQM3_9CNID
RELHRQEKNSKTVFVELNRKMFKLLVSSFILLVIATSASSAPVKDNDYIPCSVECYASYQEQCRQSSKTQNDHYFCTSKFNQCIKQKKSCHRLFLFNSLKKKLKRFQKAINLVKLM